MNTSPDDASEHGGFAGTGRADDAEHLRLANGLVNALEHFITPV